MLLLLLLCCGGNLETGDDRGQETGGIHLTSISFFGLGTCQRRCQECAERLDELRATASLLPMAGLLLLQALLSLPGGRAASTHPVQSSRHSRECVCALLLLLVPFRWPEGCSPSDYCDCCCGCAIVCLCIVVSSRAAAAWSLLMILS